MSVGVLLDQNVPRVLLEFIRRRKPEWSVYHVDEVGLHGAADSVVFAWAQERNCIVMTFDEDFADARMYPVGSHAGVIRLRVWPTTIENTEAALGRRLFDTTADEELAHALIIIDEQRIRIRRRVRHG